MVLPSEHILRVIDSHTGGEPTRTVIEGFPDLGTGPLTERARIFAERFDHLRAAIVNEPRGSEPVVGALLCPPVNPAATTGVIFFNNVGVLGMCGHGTIGVAATLARLGRMNPGVHLFETPVGEVTVALELTGSVAVANVPSRRTRTGVVVHLPGRGTVSGDVAYGGNWFFLCKDHGLPVERGSIDDLTRLAWTIRRALSRTGICGDDAAEIDHIELLAPPRDPANDGRGFVLCPGGAYDRSPCGTGTSAKLACLAADGALPPAKVWRQESVIGSVFDAWYALNPGEPGTILPSIRGQAFITAEATLVLDPRDPFVYGIR